MASGSPPPLALAYHGVADVPLRRDPHGLFVRPEDLRRHITKLRGWGYRLVSFGELAERASQADAAGLASLTFDDGFSDNLETLAPLLRDEGATATVFVVSGWLGQPHPVAPWSRIVTEQELRDLHAAGIEIGAHSSTHADLSALPYDQALQELTESKAALAAALGEDVLVAAYPYGRANADTIRACRDAGFVAACTTTARGSWAESHNLPRQDMENGASLLGLRLKRDDRYEQLMRFAPARAARRLSRQVASALR
jgi:peptidoglycan/xylan/chitin deacetylase (PgdA/CDA1 family)